MANRVWYKDNSHTMTAVINGTAAAAVVTGTLINPLGVVLWTGPLTTTGVADTYAATVDPAGAAVIVGGRYRLRVVATYNGRSLEFEDGVTVADRTAP